MAERNPRLADLSEDDRQVLEAWLTEFDERWDERLLADRAQQIPPGSSWRLPALAEMVKIDLERQWQRGRHVSLESYLKDFPELGSPADVSADLIQAEYEVRRQFGAPALLEDYLRRFPHQAGELARLIAQGGSSLSRRAASPSGFADRSPGAIPAAQELPEQFGRYRILRRLGQGGMGAVHLAEDIQLQRRVALKVANYGAQDGPEARKRLLAEARAAATLDHPYLCPVHDVGEVDARLYLTMAYIEGQSLAESTRGKSLPPRQVAALVGKLAVALQEAHAKGVIHRDLKPSNVMIKSTGQRREPVIVDFRLARRDDANANEARLTRTGQVMGTLDYMAPEQLRGEKDIGPACDIYALGVILYELLTGRLPFEGSGLAVVGQILTQAPLPPSTHRPDLDARLEAICLKAMAKTIGDRYASMAELAAALTDYLRTPATGTTPASSTSSSAAAVPNKVLAGSETLMGRLLDRVATEPEPSPEGLPPALANHPDYQIKRELGRGGMGVVYLAHNKLMGRDEVLKVMGRQITDSPELLERFLREIRAVARLRHPNIVTAYSATRVGESIVFAMEYVEGPDLAKRVQANGPSPVAHACSYIHQAALGLQHAHEEGLVHRDIKPGNLILSRKGNKAAVKILDFGLAKAAREEKLDTKLTSQGQALGTPDYIAPEQIVDAPTADIRADIYSLGSTLYFLLTGRPPFEATSLYDLYQAHISRDADPLNRLRPDVPAKLAALVAKMMAKDPAQRFQTPGEVAQALAPFFKNASAGPLSPKLKVSPSDQTNAGPPASEAGYAVTQLETEADRAIGRSRKAAEVSEAESLLGSMINFRENETPEEAEPEVAPRGRAPSVWPAVAVAVLLIGILAAWLGVVFKQETPDGVILLENVPRDAEILVDGDKVTFTWPGSGKPLEIRAIPGQHKIEVKRDGFSTFVKEAIFKTEGSEEVTVRLEPLVVVRPEPKEAAPPPPTVSKAPEPKPEVVVSPTMNDAAAASEFVSLFNGKDRSGWIVDRGDQSLWSVEDGHLVAKALDDWRKQTFILSERDYSDFVFRFEVYLPRGTDSGVELRAVPGEMPFHLEVNLRNFDEPVSLMGGLFWSKSGRGADILPTNSPVDVRLEGSWNQMEIESPGNALRVSVNGREVLSTDFRLLAERPNALPGLKRRSGRIGFQSHTGTVRFRNIEIKELNGTLQSTTYEPIFQKRNVPTP